MEKNNSLVSVLIPAYNVEKYIADALESILNQTYPHIEIVVVNDGSTDNTAQILETYQAKGVKVYHQTNRGQCAAANVAFQQSTGQLVKFFDGDDVLSADAIALQVDKLKGRSGYIASSEWARFYNDDLTTARLSPEKVWQDMLPVDWLVNSIVEGCNMMQCGIWLIPREILLKSGLWDERLSLINDFEFFTRVLLKSKGILFTKGAKLFYRSGLTSSLSRQTSRKAMESALLSVKLGTDYMLATENTSRTRKVCADVYQLWAYNFYPFFPDLTRIAEENAQRLGGSAMPVPGGKLLKNMAWLCGWKKAKRLHQLAYSLGYSPQFAPE